MKQSQADDILPKLKKKDCPVKGTWSIHTYVGEKDSVAIIGDLKEPIVDHNQLEWLAMEAMLHHITAIHDIETGADMLHITLR